MFTFTKHNERKHFCMHYLHCFSTDDLFQSHLEDCILINGTQVITMPPKGSKIYFKNHHKQLPAPFVIYADFEAITEKIVFYLLMKSHIRKLTRAMGLAVSVIKLFVIMISNIRNRLSSIEEKTQ